MGGGQVVDMHVIANASPVGRGIISSEDADLFALPKRHFVYGYSGGGKVILITKAVVTEVEYLGDVLNGPWSEHWGREAVKRLFDGKRTAPDALFCGNDQIARGAIDALRERGRSVPQDVAVVGFDNWQVMAEAARPALTSVDMNLDALGRAAGECLLDMIGGKKVTGARRLPCTLVVRGSCGG